jgi:hypothetical protein
MNEHDEHDSDTTYIDIFAQELAGSGLTPSDVPGWSLVTAAQATADLGLSGSSAVHCPSIKIPYFSLNGDAIEDTGLPFARYRMTGPVTANSAKYLSRPSTSGHMYIPSNLQNLMSSGGIDYIILTEGEKKAEALVKHGIPAIGIPGISMWHDVKAHAEARDAADKAGKRIYVSKNSKLHRELIDLLLATDVKKVIVLGDADGKPEKKDFFTADMLTKKTFKDLRDGQSAANGAVFFAAKACAGALTKAGYTSAEMFCPWGASESADGSKVLSKQGVDDWLLAAGVDAVRAQIENVLTEMDFSAPQKAKSHQTFERISTNPDDFYCDGKGFVPLGLQDSKHLVCWCLGSQDLYTLDVTKITGPQTILPLMPLSYAKKIWPKINEKTGDISVDVANAADDLMQISNRLGRFSDSSIRGAGCWPGDAPGDLIVNGKDGVYLFRNGAEPLQIPACSPERRNLYRSAVVAPTVIGAVGTSSDVQDLIRFLGKWRWQRQTDPLLLAGWLLMQAVLGALPGERPHAYITGETMAGKSTLRTMLQRFLTGAVNSFEDSRGTTPAGLRQRVTSHAITVFLDEFEPDDPQKANQRGHKKLDLSGYMELLRTSQSYNARSNSAEVVSLAKGTTDQRVPPTFLLSFSAMMSGISLVDLDASMRNRILLFELLKRPSTADRAGKPEWADIEVVGSRVRRMVWQRWPSWESRCAYITKSIQHLRTVSDRVVSTLAISITALSIGLFDDTQDDECHQFIDKLLPQVMSDHIDNAAGVSSANDSQQSLVFQRLLSCPVDVMGDTRQRAPLSKLLVGAIAEGDYSAYPVMTNASTLISLGMAIKKRENAYYLFIAGRHTGQDCALKQSGIDSTMIQQFAKRLGDDVQNSKQRVGAQNFNGVLVPLEPYIFANIEEELVAYRDCAIKSGEGEDVLDISSFDLAEHRMQ